jgi:uncharacterized damage-inducible protein DinB
MHAHVTMMAAYNAWANRRIYGACAALSDADRKADLGAFFGSLHRTLNHLVVTDRIWLARFRGETPTETRLDAVPYDDFAALRAAREAEDVAIEAFVAGLDAGRLAGEVAYVTISRPAPVRQPLVSALAHLFNHQTHHRGQCHAMLTRLAAEAPSLDLIAFQRETGMGMAA